MRIRRFSIIILILVVSPFLAFQSGNGNTPIEPMDNPNEPSTLALNALNTGHPVGIDLNASIIFDARNITIKPSSRVTVEDAITLEIHDEFSSIKYFNYSIPTIFDKFVEKAAFYSQFDSPVALQADKNIRSYTKYIGSEITTYFINIQQDGFSANSSLEEVNIFARLEAIGSIEFENLDQDQKGTLVTPIRPIYPNLRVEDSIIGLYLEAQQDEFIFSEIEKIEVNSQIYPSIHTANRRLEWRNLTRGPLDLIEGLVVDHDYTTAVFKSKTLPSAEKLSPGVTVPFEFTTARRNVRIDPWGTIFVTETMTMLHTGASFALNSTSINRDHQIGGLNYIIRSEALVTDVYDDLGSLNNEFRLSDSLYPRTTIDPESSKQVFGVNFRNKIYGGDSYTFSVDYQYRASDVVEVDNVSGFGKEYTFNATLFSDFNTTIRDLRVTFELPAGAEFLNHGFASRASNSFVTLDTKINRNTLSFFRHVEFIIDIENASFVDNNIFSIVYHFDGLGYYQYIITAVLVMVLLLSTFVALKQVRFTSSAVIETQKEKIPVDELDTFFKLFSERSGANRRKADLRDRLRKKKITKKEYEGQRKAIDRRVREINPKLEVAAKNLSEVGTKYERLVDKVMIASQKQEDVRSNMLRTRRSYRAGDTTKDIYQKLMRGYSIDLDKQEATINKSLSEISLLISEYS